MQSLKKELKLNQGKDFQLFWVSHLQLWVKLNWISRRIIYLSVKLLRLKRTKLRECYRKIMKLRLCLYQKRQIQNHLLEKFQKLHLVTCNQIYKQLETRVSKKKILILVSFKRNRASFLRLNYLTLKNRFQNKMLFNRAQQILLISQLLKNNSISWKKKHKKLH